MGVYLKDHKIGYTHQHLRKTARGYEFSERSVLKIAVLGSPQTVRTTSRGEMSKDLAVEKFSLSLDGGVATMHVSGEVQGDEMALHLASAGQAEPQRLTLKAPLYMPMTARSRLADAGLAEGRKVTIDVFDPSAMSGHPMELVVEGREPLSLDGQTRDAWLVRESFRGMTSRVWLDDDGRTLNEEGPMGLVAGARRRTTALSGGWESDAAFDLTNAIAIPVQQPVPEPRSLAAAHRSHRRPRRSDAPTDDERQSYRDGVLRIVREKVGETGSYSLPYHAERWRDELARDAVPADRRSDRSADVRRSARPRDRSAPRRRALRRWVYDSLDKVPTASIPNAVQVLEMRAGDCNEHAVLLAALARAVGLPARVVAGVVYLDGAFLYHAWNEVWLGDGWVSVDAALDQLPVDATHIKLLDGWTGNACDARRRRRQAVDRGASGPGSESLTAAKDDRNPMTPPSGTSSFCRRRAGGAHPELAVILPALRIGECARPEDVAWLREAHAVSAVVSLQDDADLAPQGTAPRARCARPIAPQGVAFHRIPIADGDAAMLGARLDEALGVLARACCPPASRCSCTATPVSTAPRPSPSPTCTCTSGYGLEAARDFVKGTARLRPVLERAAREVRRLTARSAFRSSWRTAAPPAA